MIGLQLRIEVEDGLRQAAKKGLNRMLEMAGGTLELRVELPGSGVMRLTGMGELNVHSA